MWFQDLILFLRRELLNCLDGASRACATTQLLSDSSGVTKVTLHHDIISTVTHVCFLNSFPHDVSCSDDHGAKSKSVRICE